MTTRTSRSDGRATGYAPAASRQDQIGTAIACILEGRPLPEHLRPLPPVVIAVQSVEAGIARILGGAR